MTSGSDAAAPMTKPWPARYTYSTVSITLPLLPIPSASSPASQTWSNLSTHLSELNNSSPPSTSYKLLFLARHGEGVHNVAESFYGRKAWDEKWSKLDGDERVGKWLDAELTVMGMEQGRRAGRALREVFDRGEEVGEGSRGERKELPQRWYVSPLTRCLQTARLSWSWLWEPDSSTKIPDNKGGKPVVREGLRETMGVHTCDKRSAVSQLKSKFPEFIFEEGMSEEDELWDPDHRETDEETDVRVRGMLDTMWDEGKEIQVLSLTAHSGWIASALRVTAHKENRVETGGVLPVVVKGVQVE